MVHMICSLSGVKAPHCVIMMLLSGVGVFGLGTELDSSAVMQPVISKPVVSDKAMILETVNRLCCLLRINVIII